MAVKGLEASRFVILWPTNMLCILKNCIGGEWVDGSGVTENINPKTPMTSSANMPRPTRHRPRRGLRPPRPPSGLGALEAAGAMQFHRRHYVQPLLNAIHQPADRSAKSN